MATIILEDNQSLNNKNYIIPDKIMRHLNTTLAMYGKYSQSDGYKRLKSLVDSQYNKRNDKNEKNNQISYGNLKRIKHDFEVIGNNPKDIRYILNGGNEFNTWVNNELMHSRNAVEPVNSVKKSDNIKKSKLKPVKISDKPLKVNGIKNAQVSIHENNTIYITNKQLNLLKEYRNELYLPFNGEDTLHDKPCIIHFIDWIEANGKYDTLPPSHTSNFYPLYDDSIDLACDDYFTYGNDIETKKMLQLKFLQDFPFDKYSDNYTPKFLDFIAYFNDFNEFLNDYDIEKYRFNFLTKKGYKNLQNIQLDWFKNNLDTNLSYIDNIEQNNDGLIYIYRMITIPNFETVKNGKYISDDDYDYYEYLNINYENHIGEYWAYDKKGCDSYGAGKIDINEQKITLCGLVDPSDINWTRTTCMKMDYYEEREITLNIGCNIQINSFDYTDKKGQNKTYTFKTPIILKA